MKSNDRGGTEEGRGQTPDAAAEEAQLNRLFAALGQRPEPSEEQMTRWRRSFEAELPVSGRGRRRAAGLLSGAVAAALLLTLLWPVTTPPPAASPVGRVATAFGGVVVGHGHNEVRALEPGDSIAAGERVQTGLRSGAAFDYRGADVRLDGRSAVTFHGDRLELSRGGLYVDTGPPERGVAGPVRVETPAGVIEHVGTQFLVRVARGEVMAAVREGGIVLHQQDLHGDGIRLTAAPAKAQIIVVESGGVLRRDVVDAHGTLWSFALAASAGLSLDGRDAHAVLDWSAREQGRRVEYQSDEASRIARRSRLRGSAGAVGPVAAADIVDASTRLRIDVSDPAVLRVYAEDAIPAQ